MTEIKRAKLLKENNASARYDPVCVVDDDPMKVGKQFEGGVTVVGTTDDIERFAREFAVEQIIFAIPSCPEEKKRKILDTCGIDRSIKVGEWNDEQIAAIRTLINEEYKIEGELRSSVQMDIKRLMDIGCYRGIRHRSGLPVRGQSTKNNARTRKGKKKTVANKKKATK